ncbi:flagellin [Solibacillus sp. FSL K6-4121]|uniref:flagellin n=1 Tax=Solibacillus sp. FSL K6-4121 TaxID=2921505 RepID=UPI0030F82B24
MRIHYNQGLFTQNRYNQTNTELNKTLNKLSSGYQINQAADDAAGLGISEKMRSQIRGLEKAEKNIQDGTSLIQVADSSLNGTHENLQRARELVIQAANDTLTPSDRQMIQKEIEQIKDGINDIANNTEFNGIHLLNVPQETIEISKTETIIIGTETITQTNPTTNKIISVKPGVEHRVTAGYIEIPDPPVPSPLEIEALFGTITGANWPDMNVKSPTGELFGYNTPIMPGSDYQENTSNTSSDKATYSGYSASNEKMTFENPISGRWYIEIRHDGGQDTSTFNLKSNYLIYDEYTTESTITTTIPKTETVTTIEKIVPKPLLLQVGPNEGHHFKVSLTDARTTALNIDQIVVDPYEKIKEALERIDEAIQKISGERGKYGTYQNALEHILNNVSNTKENLTRAESQLRDADMAKEMSKLKKDQVLLQSSQSMMAQINQMSQGILEILG